MTKTGNRRTIDNRCFSLLWHSILPAEWTSTCQTARKSSEVSDKCVCLFFFVFSTHFCDNRVIYSFMWLASYLICQSFKRKYIFYKMMAIKWFPFFICPTFFPQSSSEEIMTPAAWRSQNVKWGGLRPSAFPLTVAICSIILLLVIDIERHTPS